MTKLNQNVRFFQGEEKKISVTVTDVNGDPVAFSTIDTALYRVAKTAKSTSVLEKTETDITQGGSDNWLIDFVHDDTDELKSGTYYHDLRVYASGVELVIFEGSFTILDSPTNIAT